MKRDPQRLVKTLGLDILEAMSHDDRCATHKGHPCNCPAGVLADLRAGKVAA